MAVAVPYSVEMLTLYSSVTWLNAVSLSLNTTHACQHAWIDLLLIRSVFSGRHNAGFEACRLLEYMQLSTALRLLTFCYLPLSFEILNLKLALKPRLLFFPFTLLRTSRKSLSCFRMLWTFVLKCLTVYWRNRLLRCVGLWLNFWKELVIL